MYSILYYILAMDKSFSVVKNVVTLLGNVRFWNCLATSGRTSTKVFSQICLRKTKPK